MRTRNTLVVAFGLVSAVCAVACEDNSARSTPNSNTAPATPTAQTTPPAANPANPANTEVTNTNATVTADPLLAAENKDSVKQYPDEIRFTPPRAAKMITGFSTAVRSEPSGESISTVESTANITEVARDPRGNYYLVLYPDPSHADKQLAGWVNRDAVENVAWSTSVPAEGKGLAPTMAAKLDCTKGQAHVRTDRDFCAKTCKDDKGCDKDKSEICDGLAFEVHEKSGKLSNTRYCISSSSSAANDAHGPQHGASPALDQK